MIKSLLLQVIPNPRHRVVTGTHELASGAKFTITRISSDDAWINVKFVEGASDLTPRALRELAELCGALADAMEGK